ncbi:hypothetical protein TSUD_61060 [Trifolium subterraneum]|uniref:Uncharacterized protein n=1 Tax=Trifolium subterraneum TaxID=3900 RepID=A0A2Z6NDN7_TRISU|nr:hypothetical protein TSUD_61060 [Trifolium subterraneum]
MTIDGAKEDQILSNTSVLNRPRFAESQLVCCYRGHYSFKEYEEYSNNVAVLETENYCRRFGDAPRSKRGLMDDTVVEWPTFDY